MPFNSLQGNLRADDEKLVQLEWKKLIPYQVHILASQLESSIHR